jgi:hypothetical protein
MARIIHRPQILFMRDPHYVQVGPTRGTHVDSWNIRVGPTSGVTHTFWFVGPQLLWESWLKNYVFSFCKEKNLNNEFLNYVFLISFINYIIQYFPSHFASDFVQLQMTLCFNYLKNALTTIYLHKLYNILQTSYLIYLHKIMM